MSSLLTRSALPRVIARTALIRPFATTYRFSSAKQSGIMSEATNVYTKEAPFPLGPYSQAVKTPNAIYCSGQIPLTADGTFIEGSIADKTKQCIVNLEAVLKESGSAIQKVVKTTIFLSDMAHFAEMNGEYEKWFTHKPARSCVAVKTLPKNVDVEIEAIALP
ncbi:endoribonuclease L-PSP [Plectosphaerella cucumerina]|uniref:Endoribonuclease L-PSP n=1 Tax=Plectosphaerella cucumerina TaxID=40658 RepID=A0A8K0X2T4_9PEZI|nr:endoribonuclease L-PSP [Plectosphaerella cucumerina]